MAGFNSLGVSVFSSAAVDAAIWAELHGSRFSTPTPGMQQLEDFGWRLDVGLGDRHFKQASIAEILVRGALKGANHSSHWLALQQHEA